MQKPPRGNGQAITQDHALDCEKHGSDDPANLLECLYLYREFESEALRILVPYTKNGVDEQVVQSFMAAVQLGLKKHYRGQVDHLRMVMQDEPGKDEGPRRHYVMLYDAVPGGTGYLHQLLADQAKTFAACCSWPWMLCRVAVVITTRIKTAATAVFTNTAWAAIWRWCRATLPRLY